MPLYARSTDDGKNWQLLTEHLANVSDLAGAFAEAFGARNWGRAAGLLHDWGKASEEFQSRLHGSGKSVDHSTAGAQVAASRWKGAGTLLAACIAGHHGGLSDGISDRSSALISRLRKSIPVLTGKDELPTPETIGKLPIKVVPGKNGTDQVRLAFQISFFVRMLFSCLVDADFLDTERFMDSQKSVSRKGYPGLKDMEKRFREKIDFVVQESRATPINLHRKEILESCLTNAQRTPGLFSLTVPTGGGKTLSSLAFALEHALAYGLNRIIYVIPFTSIIEQNAEVFRNFTGRDAVLEHHSAFDSSKLGQDPENNYALRKFELAAENWDAPLIVTTGVQFFESLFSSKPSRCRKLHNIANSVVILDEAQMLPANFLLPCLEALRELAANYRTSVVLCTATQPALSLNSEFQKGLEGVREIVPDPRGLYNAFRRVEVERAGVLTMNCLLDRLRESSRALCIVNTRFEASEVFKGLQDLDGSFHLSALMCPEHRSQHLALIKDRLQKGLSCRVVSTRLIEAGVDIDFPLVFRALAGIDSIAQAAGRCNREGKLPHYGRLVVFQFENRMPPGPFRAPSEIAAEMMRKYPDDILSLEVVEDYFRHLYWRAGDLLDAEKIMDLLEEGLKDCLYPFETVSRKFRIIKEEGEAIIIPFDENARRIIAGLRYAEFPRSLLREAQIYAVQVYPQGLINLENAGVIERIQAAYPALAEYGYTSNYSREIGLILPNSETESALWVV